MELLKNSASFRDPAGQIYEYNNRIIRIVKKFGKERYELIKKKNIIEESINKNFLINTKDVTEEFKNLKNKNDCYFLEHDKLEYISYPYEWNFYQLKAAALHHLDFQIFLINKDVVLIDSSAYNIQFINHKPIFIDVLSLENYKEGEYWLGHSQFLQQFLNPLLLRSIKGIQFNEWYKGNLDGIKTTDLNDILNFRDKLSLNVFFSVVLLSRLEKKNKTDPEKALNKLKNKKSLSKNSYKSILIQLRNWIDKLEPLNKKTQWDSYSSVNTYEKDQQEKKLKVVNDFSKKYKPKTIVDIGCNDGLYSFECLRAGAEKVIGFDIDINSIERAYKKAVKENLNFLPLYFNALNPSSKLGWNEKERKSFNERINFDAMIALAFEHHLTLANNVPLEETIKWLMNIAPKGLIEFVDKNDETVKKMLSLKGDIFPDYNLQNFEKNILLNGKIINKTIINDTRVLYEFNKD